MQKFLKFDREGSIAILVMNQPAERNPLTGNSAVPELIEVCRCIEEDTSIKVAILTGAGKAFCSGGNVKDMRRYSVEDIPPHKIMGEYRQGIQRLSAALYGLAVPLIAAVNGPAIGAGCDLACMCDIRIASEAALFAESFIRVGIVPGDGGAWFLPRIVGMSKAAEMSFTGDAIDATQALTCGLVSQVTPAEGLMPAALALAGRIAQNPGTTLRMTKRLLREGQHLRLDSLLELSASYQAIAHKTGPHTEAVAAFIEKRKPQFD